MRIVQVGVYPPPFGGVSVHLQRLHDHLRRQGRDSLLLDLSGIPKASTGVRSVSWPVARSWLRRAERSIVHFHNFAPHLAATFHRAARRHVVVLSLHDERFADEIRRSGTVRSRLARFHVRRLACVVVNNRSSESRARRLLGRRAEIRLIPEFIPPLALPALADPGLLELRRRHRFLVASAAASIPFRAGAELYGLDLLVGAVGRLVRERGLDVALALLLPTVGDEGDLAGLRERCRALAIADRVRLVTEPLPEAGSLWREADVTVRATTSDGNSLAVLEALSLGVPVVASDCVERPEGAELFRTRDGADLARRLESVLTDLPRFRARVRAVSHPGSARAFLELYDGLAGRSVAHAA